MSPELQSRLITLAKAIALLGILILGFLWLISWGTSKPEATGAADTNAVAMQDVTPTPAPQTAGVQPPDTQSEEGEAGIAQSPPAAAEIEPSQTAAAVAEKDPGDEYYRMGLYQEALKFWQVRADRGDGKAAYRLGVEYLDGKDGVVARDYSVARKYYEVAALKGDARAQFELGTLYQYGHGTDKSPEQAALWYRKAAERGYPQAQWTLATLLEKGEGIEKNEVEALRWYYIAADNGFRGTPVTEAGETEQSAPFAYEVLAMHLTKEQADEARMRASEFTPVAE